MAQAVPRFAEWLTSETVGTLSRSVGDTADLAQYRQDAHARFLRLPIEPNPLYRGYGYFANVDLTGIDPAQKSPAVPLPPLAKGTIRAVHDGSGTRVFLPPELAGLGVELRPFEAIWSAGESAVRSFLGSAEEPTDRLSALAAAVVNRGYELVVPDGLTEPIRLEDYTVLSAAHEALSVHRSLKLGARNQLLVTEEAFSTAGAPDAQRLLASSTEIALGEEAKAIHLGVHAPDAKTVAIYRRRATTSNGSRIGWLWNGLGGYRAKIRNQTTLRGSGSAVNDLQTFFGAGDSSYDSSVDITHIGTDTHGSSITRGVFRDQGRGMSRGLVRIEPNARKTVAFVSEHAMLLSKGARSDTIPILEILCRDVKATHSTSVAPVDQEKIFYLESRGFPQAEAVRMVAEGFLAYVYERAPVAGLRELLYPLLAARWDGRPIAWEGPELPVLPAPEVTGTEAAPEWRFDAKLR
jgi:Fe-S cluster assembly scaffold protein SufB